MRNETVAILRKCLSYANVHFMQMSMLRNCPFYAIVNFTQMSILRKCSSYANVSFTQMTYCASVLEPKKIIFASKYSRDGSTDDEIAAEYQMMANGVDNEFLGFEVSFSKYEIFHL